MIITINPDWLIWLVYAIIISAALSIVVVARRLFMLLRVRTMGSKWIVVKSVLVMSILFIGGTVLGCSLISAFNQIEIRAETVKLSYAWPRKDVVLSKSDVRDIHVVTYARGRRIALVVRGVNQEYISSTSKRSAVEGAFTKAITAVKE